jgi:septum formation protein
MGIAMSSGTHSFWRGKMPLVLASKSASRQALLASAKIPFEAAGAAIDERVIEAPLLAEGVSASVIAGHLAEAKARAVANRQPGRLVLGADQTLAFEGRLFSKPETLADARAQLLAFSSRTHELHAALCVLRDDEILFTTVVTASLTCWAYDESFVDLYLATAGETVLSSVGAYQIEGLGIHLFERIDGDHSTILGLPLLPLLAFLRREGSLA